MEIVEYDIEDIKRNLNTFKLKLDCLRTLPENTKMIINDNNILCIDTWTICQAAVRKLRGQTRININQYLKSQLSDYLLLLKMINETYLNYKSNTMSQDYDNILEIIKEVLTFNNEIKKGLSNTKKIYTDYDEIKTTIDNINKGLNHYIDLFNTFISS